MRDIVGGLDLEEEEIAVEQSHKAVVAGEEVKEELCLSESDNFSLLRAHYSVMKWITLKSNNLPIVALEIERAIEVFTSLLDKTDPQGASELAPEVCQLREDLQIRIRELDQYYRQHSLDENISIFHMIKLKLERTVFLSQRTQPKSVIQSKADLWEEPSESLLQESEVKWLDQPLFAYYQSSPRKKEGKISKISLSQVQQQKISQHMKPAIFKTQKKKTQASEGSAKLFSKAGKESMVKRQSAGERKFGRGEVLQFKPSRQGPTGIQTPAFGEDLLSPVSLLQQMKKSSELKFTIKMTKEEYKELLEMKKQMNVG